MKYQINNLLVAISLVFVATSCQKLLIEPTPESSTEQNFEIFWNDLNNSYPFFKRDNVDWQEMYDKYRPEITSSTSNEKLASIFIQMLSPLSDQHISLTTPFVEWQQSQPRTKLEFEFDSALINRNYLNFGVKYIKAPILPEKTKKENVGEFGIINKGDGDYIYFRVETFLTEHPFENTLDSIITKNPAAKGIIIDVRRNGGGLLYSMINLLGTFTSNPSSRFITYAFYKEKVGPLDDSFGFQYSFPLYSNGNTTYKKPVALLTDRNSYSAAEHASLAMRKISNGFIVGDTTGGAMSPIVERTLPNGFNYTVVNSITTDPLGRIYEKVGVPPTYRVIRSSSETDDVIDKAITEINIRSISQ